MARYAGLALLLLAASARAQDAPEMVDADLLYAFTGIEDASALTIGEAPPRLSRVFPSGTRVLGALSKTPSGIIGGGTQVAAVGRLDVDAAQAALAYEAEPPAGWRTHDWWTGDPGGFTSSPPGDAGIVLCPDDPAASDGPLRIQFADRPGGGALVSVIEGEWYRRACDGTANDAPPFSGVHPPQVDLSELPELHPPPGGRHDTQGGGGSHDYRRQETTLTWDGTATDALTHYAAQLERAGWTPLASGGRPDSAAGTWTRAADDGSRTVTITAVRTGQDTLALRLTIASHSNH